MFNYEFPPIGGGGGWVSYFLGKHLATSGHQVHLITSRFENLPKHEVIENITVHRVPVLRKRKDVCAIHEMMTYAISSTIYGFHVANQFQPDVVQVFFGIPSGGCAYLLEKTNNIPYVVFLGGRDVPRPNPDPPYYRWLYLVLSPIIQSIWRSATAVIACSNGLRELAYQTDQSIKIDVIPDGLDLHRFFSIERNPCSTPVKILTVGRLIPRKGFQFLIQALPDVCKQTNADFRIQIVGDGPYRSELVTLAENLNVSDKIDFLGSIDYANLPQKYHEADIFTLCSLAEGMPLVVLEAMGTGLPIIASQVQGITDLVKIGINGELFDPGNVNQLVKHLVRLIDDGKRRVKMGKKSTELAQGYGWENIAQSYLELYKKVIRIEK